MSDNIFSSHIIEYHILQSFPVTCLNRDDVGAPKSAIVGGVSRARVSSQCWKRAVRMHLPSLGLRTKKLADILKARFLEKGSTPLQAELCSSAIASTLASDTLVFVSPAEIDKIVTFAAKKGFALAIEKEKTKKGAGEEKNAEEESKGVGNLNKKESALLKECLSDKKDVTLDIALFGRMFAQAHEINIQAASSFSHAISTHQAVNEIEFFTALDDCQKEEDSGSSHMGTLEYNSATYYRYVSLDLGLLADTIGADKVRPSVDYFTKALYLAVPSARQNTQSGACLWDYARIFVRKGQRMQVCFDSPVRSKGTGWLEPSIAALDAALERHEKLSGSLFGKEADLTFGKDTSFSIDDLCSSLSATLDQIGGKQ